MLVNKAPLAAVPYAGHRRQSVVEFPGAVKLRIDEKLALLVDIAPFAVVLTADPDCGQSFSEVSSSIELLINGDRPIPGYFRWFRTRTTAR